MEKILDFNQLKVWQKSHRLALEVYKLTKELPSEERFGLVSQMRRAAVSVPANIAEGFRKRSKRDKSNFYNIAQASLDELCYYFILCRDLKYEIDFQRLADEATEINRMLSALIRSLGS